MSEINYNSAAAAPKDWCLRFAEGALKQASHELRAFRVYGNHGPLATQQKIVGAALAIGFMLINEVGG